MKISKKYIAVFMAPALCLVSLVYIYPCLRTIGMSFFDVSEAVSPISTWRYTGFYNFARLAKSPLFLKSMTVIFKLWLLCGAVTMFLAFVFAVCLTQNIRGQKFFRAIVYMPRVIASIAIGYMWLFYVFNNQFGLFKKIFTAIGWQRMAEFQWLDQGHIFLSMSIAFVFSNVGYYMMMFIAGIEKIPEDYYEAATLEGASIVQSFFKITLPLVRGVFGTAFVLWTSGTMGFFALAQVFQGFNTYTPMYFTYMVLFGTEASNTANSAGLAAAAAVTMTGIVLIVSAIIQRVIKDVDADL